MKRIVRTKDNININKKNYNHFLKYLFNYIKISKKVIYDYFRILNKINMLNKNYITLLNNILFLVIIINYKPDNSNLNIFSKVIF